MVRRVVSGMVGRATSHVIIDGKPAKVFDRDGFSLADIWATEGSAPDLKDEGDITTSLKDLSMDLAPGATRFPIVEFPPSDAPGLMRKTPTMTISWFSRAK